MMQIVLLSGYGIFARKDFKKGEFLVEYAGDMIDPVAADAISDQTYVYYFSWSSTKYRLLYNMHLVMGSVIFVGLATMFIIHANCDNECLVVCHYYRATLC